jgi:hypothetical protein
MPIESEKQIDSSTDLVDNSKNLKTILSRGLSQHAEKAL